MLEFWSFGKVRAVLEPKRLDDLKPTIKQFIGREAVFEALWIISEEDGGNYVGQYAMGVPREWASELWADRPDAYRVGDGFSWVPQEDLRILEVIDPGIDCRAA